MENKLLMIKEEALAKLEACQSLKELNDIRVFYLGKKEGKWGYTNPNYKDYKGETPDWLEPSDIYYGDDWDDAPYEHNAGTVYEWFVKGYIDIFEMIDGPGRWNIGVVGRICGIIGSFYPL